MVFKNLKAFFYHVPKTAGSSIEVALYGGRPGGELLHNKRGYRINYQHAFPDEVKSDLWSFAFVRNPWDRWVSYYHHVVRLKLIPQDLPFEKLVMGLRDGFKQIPWRQPHNAVDFMAPATSWADGADFVGRFEHLHRDFDIVCQHLGVAGVKLPHLNATKHQHYSAYYNADTVELIGSTYSEDISRYGYEFGEPT
jgi:hypothetical protein